MPYGDANAIVVEMAGEVLPVVRDVPVLAGVCGTDPFRLMPRFLDELAAIGFAGVQNFPTVGLIDGVFRQNLEETGMSYAAEVEMIRLAAQRGLLTCPYVFDPGQAEQMARAGADVLVPHMGLTTSGTIGAQTALTLDEAVERVQAMRDAAVAVNPEILVLCHGGPIAEPATRGTCSRAPPGSAASSAPHRWSGCPSSARSPPRCAPSPNCLFAYQRGCQA